ncbi:unnamed protein product [Knipowitschia caucasica]|uniref:CCHC-type domain-containing protein n=1 Tax=Knipowitschia caucasica TaxID=637954 RepID=A0AAV2KW49_KNICA
MATADPNARRNVVRFDLSEDLEMDRLTFSRQLLQKVLEVSTHQLDFIFAFPGRQRFELVFTTSKHLETCLQVFYRKRTNSPFLQKVTVTPLMEVERKTVHIVIWSERVRVEDVKTWASFYCNVLQATEVVDIDGVKTGTKRLEVTLKRETGEIKHLPNSIQLGAYRGAVYYAGQPKRCRRCGSLDHFAAECQVTHCRKCNATDHATNQCLAPMKCNLCTADTHRFKDCPKAYSNRLKGQITPALSYPEIFDWSDEQREDTQSPVADTVEIPDPGEKEKELKVDTPASSTTPPEVRLLQQKTLGAEKILDGILAQLPAQPPARAPDDGAPGVEETRDQVGQHTSSSDQDLILSLDLQRIPEASSPVKEPLSSLGDLFLPLPDSLRGRQTSLKRPQESSSEESGHLDKPQKVWPAPSIPFLDPDHLNLFSTITQIRDPEGPLLETKKKKKKKRTSK